MAVAGGAGRTKCGQQPKEVLLFAGCRRLRVSNCPITCGTQPLRCRRRDSTWLTLGLSLIAAVATALLALFHFRDRCFLYRNLHDDLLGAAWHLLQSSAPE